MKQHPLFLLSLSAIGLSCLAASAQLPRENPGKDPAYILKTAAAIDRFVGQGFTAKKITPIATAEDPIFLRRSYLDIIGRIPTAAEADAFLKDTDAQKRTKLVDKLLDSPGYVQHMYNFVSDTLRATSNMSDSSRSGIPYLRYIRKSIIDNKPYDKFVFELLTASGRAWALDNGAVGYFERDRGMPLDNMANTTRIFLGTHIECAQCHDHPYDNWKQLDFFEMAAFTHGLGSKTGNNISDEIYKREREADKKEGGDKERADLVRFLNENFYDYGVEGDGDGKLALPADFNGKGGKPMEEVKSKSILPGARNGGREEFAKWLTGPKNERFVKIIANRMWKRVMGVGMFEPVDKFRDSKDTRDTPTIVSNPALLTFLEQVMREVQFDLKAFQRILFNTKSYALGTNPDYHDIRQPYDFRGRLLRRMSAEQVWDSLTTLVVPDLDLRMTNSLSPAIRVYGREVLGGKKTMFQLHDELMAIKSADEFYAYVTKFMGEIKSGGGGSGDMMSDPSMMMTTGAGTTAMDSKTWAGYSPELVRASELPSPTSPSHFLRKFGQSSREVIEGASTESDVTQILSLINGHVEKNIVNDNNSVMMKAADQAKDPKEKVRSLFLSILSRPPTEVEMTLMEPEAKNGSAGEKNIIYALINSSEFMFIQ